MRRLKAIPGICDRCGQRFDLKDLKFEYLLGRNTGVRACRKCIDPSHPQLDTRNIRTDDKQYVKDSRSDSPEFPEERRMFAWNPVGTPVTGTAQFEMGHVSVEIT